MSRLVSTLRARLRPVFSAGAMWAMGLAGVAGVLAPAALIGNAWPPLHARCMAVTAFSLCVALALARRTLDPAALHTPLLALGCWLLSAVALTWVGGGVLSVLHGILVALGGVALALAPIEGDTPAPAQHPDRSWRSFAVLALLLALPLLVVPRSMVAYWPWRLSAQLVAQYAAMFMAWGVAAWLVSRERRRYVRMPVLCGVLVWAAGVLLTSLWHLSAFRLRSPPAWLWFVAFAATAAMAAHHLWPAGWRHPRRLLGP